MTKEETKMWLDSLKKDIGQPQYQALWHYAEAIDMAIEALADMPIGEWIEDEYCDRHCVCSHCGGSSGTQFDGVQPIPLKTKFCPNCGAKMFKGGGC